MVQDMGSLLLLVLLVPAALLQEECDVSSCHPQLGDLMVGRSAQLSASSTCGLNGPQTYCILGHLEGEQKCFTCDSRQPFNRVNNPESHQIENVIATFDPEHRTKWWQSESGVQQVSIVLDLETLFQFSHLVLTFKTFRPTAMLVERSRDFGHSWKVFRYFAEDCASQFPSVSTGPADSVDDVICDSRYSGSEPSTDGEVVLKALDPSFEIENPYDPEIQELITMTNLRVNFTRLFTLGDTLLARKRRNPQDKYYYALYNMVVRGSCFCNGHASQCIPTDGTRGDVFNEPGMINGRCVCQHNTMGTNCERCQEFHNDSPWSPAGQTDTHVCRGCNCNGHSQSCHFDPARYQASGGVSGGVCDNCLHDRVGLHCEQCRPYYYQDPQRSIEDPQGCIPCECDPAGTLGVCDPSLGRCICKENVEGERCDRCKFGFYGLREEDPSGCQMCRCNLLGSAPATDLCDPATGQCVCQRLVTGPLCDQCLPGYWGLGNTIHTCKPCVCDIGGAYSSMCSTEDGHCHCFPNMVGQSCSAPAPGHFLAPLDYYLYEAENAAPVMISASLVDPKLPKCEQYYRQQGYDFKLSHGRFVLTRNRRQARRRRQEQRTIPLDPGSALQIVPRERTTDAPITWTGPGFVRVLDEAGLRFTVDNIPSSLDYQIVIRYEPESPDDWIASVNIVALSPGDGSCTSDPTGIKTFTLSGSARVAILDTPVCLNMGGRYYVDITFLKQPSPDPQSSMHTLIDSMGMIPKMESLQDFCSQSDLDSFRQFRCVEMAAEVGQPQTLPDVCEALIGSMSARIHNGAVPCRCNFQGSLGPSCSKFGGLCECKPNVVGRCCDTCAPMTFGFGSNGCTPCGCDPRGSVSELCDQVRGQCPCRRELAGRQCDRCQPGYYGFPLCHPCECNGLAELCDADTGACLDCREHSTGPNCDRCVEGYYGDPISREPCEPCLCPDTLSSERFFARSCNKDPESQALTCNCLTGHIGPRCDACASGFYGDLTAPGARCAECPCNDNIDPSDSGSCDRVTGECLRCLYNTQGRHCESCKPGFYGFPQCRPCECNDLAELCDPETGTCLDCREHSTGPNCDRCVEGYYGDPVSKDPCEPCLCPDIQSSERFFARSCRKDPETRALTCNCLTGHTGPHCDACGPGFYGNLTALGAHCEECPCNDNIDPDDSGACDRVTGECLRCLYNTQGRHCESCKPGFYGFPHCRPCECNGLAELCDPETGACLDCREHSTGPNCDRCVEGYYGDPISRDPCEPCLCPDIESSERFFATSCSKDPESRALTCNCLTGHTGPHCDACISGFYGDLTAQGAHCEECPCNNNIDPGDSGACDRVTGECLHCLHNTQGQRCESCKPGYYGDALAQDCKECSCDRRGTEVFQCPLGSPCFCDSQTGQCQCRRGAFGELCDTCEDGYWNIQGESGCQPCNCDPTNSLNNLCDKVTGQCQCSPEFGGRQCDECGENHFGNPDLQCISCDCNMEGTERPACDTYTGECLCRVGVTGIFCDECAPGFDSVFPACTPCHPCSILWAENVTDVQRAAQRMRTFIPRHGDEVQPGYSRRWQRMLEMHSKLDWLVNLTGRALPEVEKVEKLCLRIGKLKDTIDPNAIIIDPSSLLNTEIDNIRHEFKNLLNNLRDKTSVEPPDTDREELEEALDEIRKLHKEYMIDEKRVKKAEKAVEDSMDTRLAVKDKLASCSAQGDMEQLEKKVKALSVAELNENICGAPGEVECSKSECGGALCRDILGLRECGGPTCKGSVPVSKNATETAEQVENDILSLLHNLRESKIKINEAKEMTQDTQDQADKLKKKINDSKEKFEKEKKHTKDIIKKVKDYLTDEMVAPEDIEKLAEAVLAIQLPGSPDEIRTMIQNIRGILSNLTEFQEDLKSLEDQAKIAQDIQEKAMDIRNRVKNIDVNEIKKAMEDAEKAQDKVSEDLENAKNSKDMAEDKIKEIEKKLKNMEPDLNSTRIKDLLDEIEALKNKTKMNGEQARDAKADADAALANATDAETELDKVKDLFNKLKEGDKNQDLQEIANERLKNLTMEAEEIKKKVEDKMQEIEDLEKRIKDFITSKEDKDKEVAMLLEMVESIRKDISTRVDEYINCF